MVPGRETPHAIGDAGNILAFKLTGGFAGVHCEFLLHSIHICCICYFTGHLIWNLNKDGIGHAVS